MSRIDDSKLSKTLAWLLRHGALKEGLDISPDGFVSVDSVLGHRSFSGYTLQDIERITNSNDKKRYELRLNSETKHREIRAYQGHSLPCVDSSCLLPITRASEEPVVVHGTYLANWLFIKTQGLKRMTRNHIHFATGLPENKSVISGMRKTCEVHIYMNLDKALKAGIKFFKSGNNVILSPGDEQGILSPVLFSCVKLASDGKLLNY